MDIEREPEIASIFEGQTVPTWVTRAVDAAVESDADEASVWAEALALAFGRRANRLTRERLGPSTDGDRY